MATTDFYPEASPATAATDGLVTHTNNPATAVWATLRDTITYTTATLESNTDTLGLFTKNNNSNVVNTNARVFTLFDTSVIAGGAVTAATLSIYKNALISNSDPGANATAEIVSVSPASNTTLAVTDYLLRGSTSFSSLNYTALSASAYNDFVLSTPATAVDASGVTKLGMISGFDLNDVQPTYPSNDDGIVTTQYYADDPGNTRSPKLNVTYGAVSTSVRTIFGTSA